MPGIALGIGRRDRMRTGTASGRFARDAVPAIRQFCMLMLWPLTSG